MILENDQKAFQELHNRIIWQNFEHYCLKPRLQSTEHEIQSYTLVNL